MPSPRDLDDLDDVVALERLLLDADFRASPGRLDELLHPDFVEFGASGKVWDRASTIAALTSEPEMRSGVPGDFTATPLGEDAVLVTYRITGRRGSLRSSLWVHESGAGWRLRFHQGTLS